jgi:hypothetical protein
VRADDVGGTDFHRLQPSSLPLGFRVSVGATAVEDSSHTLLAPVRQRPLHLSPGGDPDVGSVYRSGVADEMVEGGRRGG